AKLSKYQWRIKKLLPFVISSLKFQESVMGLGMLVQGKWVTERNQADEKGGFVRPNTTFRNFITADGSSGFPAVSGRYHLYVSLACPWAHRTVIMRKLKGLESAIGLTVVDPVRDERGWAFRDGEGFSHDPVNG